MTEQKKISIYCLIMCLLIIVLDQASKYSVLAFLTPGQPINIIPCFNLTLSFNLGVSFGLLSPSTHLGYYMIITLTILCICAICYFFAKTQIVAEKIMASFIIGGAIGNLIDRIIHGAVIDFIDIYYKNMHWPVFNIADTFITIGVFVIVIHNISQN